MLVTVPVNEVVAVAHLGTPLRSTRYCPFTPAVVVASRPLPLPKSIVFACSACQPVPPWETMKAPSPKTKMGPAIARISVDKNR